MTEEAKKQLVSRIEAVKMRIAQAAKSAGRSADEIALVAATKMNDGDTVRAAIENGISTVGENRVQELLSKYEENAYKNADLHFIGALQSNKVKYLMGKASLIQSVDSIRLAQVISKEAQKHNLTQDILLEVNIGEEASKSGFSKDAINPAIEQISCLSNIKVRGIMAIPPIADETNNTRYFDKMHQLFVDILSKKYDNVYMDYLSMGMTNDFENAIRCGSNMVRIGTAIFGERSYRSV